MSEPGAPDVVCANPDCRIGETGKCVEGMEKEKCPHFGRSPPDATEPDTARDGVSLPPGGTLDITGAAKLLRGGETRVIAVIGPSDAGKTSLIAGLYDLFQDGPVAGVDFAGSLSLHEFEHVCHDARAASRRGIPHISRTPRGEVKFYHLDIAGGAATSGLTLVVGDRAGEEYRGAIDDVSGVAEFVEVMRADSLAVLVDGERLLDTGARHNLRSEIALILQALIEGGAIAAPPRLAIILTKFDLVQESAHRMRAEADFANLVAHIERTFAGRFSLVRPFQVAASPKSDVISRGAGIADLLSYWLHAAPIPPTLRPAIPDTTRAFGRLKVLENIEARR
jgi:hypothetical protein